MFATTKSLCSKPKTNIIFYVNDISKTNVFSSNIFTLTSHGQRRLEDYSPWGHKSQT